MDVINSDSSKRRYWLKVSTSGEPDMGGHCWDDGPPTTDGEGTSCILPPEHSGEHYWVADDQTELLGLQIPEDKEEDPAVQCHLCPESINSPAVGLFHLPEGCVVSKETEQPLCWQHAGGARDDGALAGIELIEDLTDGWFKGWWDG